MSNSESFNYNIMEVMVLGVNKKDKDGVLFTRSGKHVTRNLDKKNTEMFYI